MLAYYSYIIFQKLCYYLNYFLKILNFSNSYPAHYYCSSCFVFFFFFCIFQFLLPCFFMSVRCSSKKDAISFIMAFQSGCRLEDLAVPSPSLRRCFINNSPICSLFYLFCLFSGVNKQTWTWTFLDIWTKKWWVIAIITLLRSKLVPIYGEHHFFLFGLHHYTRFWSQIREITD